MTRKMTLLGVLPPTYEASLESSRCIAKETIKEAVDAPIHANNLVSSIY